MLCSVCNLALPKLLPHLGCRVRQDGIHERRDDADGLGGRGEHAGLQRGVIRLGAVGGLLPRRVGGQVAVGLGDEEPEALQRFREVEVVEGRSEARRSCGSALSRRAVSVGVSGPASGTTPPKYLCTMLTTRLTRLP